MIFANYSDFRNKFQQMFDGDDISTSDISGNVLDLIIAAGEQRIYRELRSSACNLPYSWLVVNNSFPVPADYLELKGAPYVPAWGVSTYKPWEDIQNLINLGNCSSNHPNYYSFDGDNLIFYPALTNVTITGRYYSRLPDISLGLNAFFNRHPDVFLYAGLAECAPFLGELDRLPIWEQKYTTLVESANEQELRRITRGSKLATRVG